MRFWKPLLPLAAPLILTPKEELNATTLPAAAVGPPMTLLFPKVDSIPPPTFPSAEVPVTSVPILFPWIVLSLPVLLIPVAVLAEMRLPAPGSVPPIRLLFADERTIPHRLPRAACPDRVRADLVSLNRVVMGEGDSDCLPGVPGDEVARPGRRPTDLVVGSC